jgi:hypothetical protein
VVDELTADIAETTINRIFLRSRLSTILIRGKKNGNIEVDRQIVKNCDKQRDSELSIVNLSTKDMNKKKIVIV